MLDKGRMTDRESLREDNYYVLLLPTADEQFLTRDEMRDFLVGLLQEHPHLVVSDLERYTGPAERAQRLLDTTCSLELNRGQFIQWYAVRLSK